LGLSISDRHSQAPNPKVSKLAICSQIDNQMAKRGIAHTPCGSQSQLKISRITFVLFSATTCLAIHFYEQQLSFESRSTRQLTKRF